MEKTQKETENRSTKLPETRHVRVGRPWDGELEIEVQRAGILGRINGALLVLLGVLGLYLLVTRDAGFARDLLSFVKEVLLVIIGWLIRPSRAR